MKRYRLNVRTVEALLVAMFATSCAQYATVATRTVTAIGAAEVAVAKAGAEAHKAELGKFIDEARAKRAELACGVSGKLVPIGCKVDEWDEYRAAAGERLDAAKKRYADFVLAMRTVDASLTEVALSVRVYLDTSGEGNLASALAGLVKAWGVAAALAKEYGVVVPDVNGGK